MKKILSVLLIFVMCFSLCGCAFLGDVMDMSEKEKAKTFEFDGITIELTTKFLRMDFISEDFDFTVGNEIITVIGKKFNADELGDPTVLEFAEYYTLLLKDNNPSPVTEIEGIPTTGYTAEDHTFLLAYYKGSDSFWIISFGTLSTDYQSNYDNICNYAKSVKCE